MFTFLFLSVQPFSHRIHAYQQIHVDRYKHNVYSHVSGDPFLRSIITRDAASTRFHACERFDRCEYVDAPREDPSSAKAAPSINASARHVVYVNPVTMGLAAWELYQEETKSKLARGETVNILVRSFSVCARAFGLNCHC